MDRQFLRSKEFLVAAVLAALAVGAGAYAAVSVFPQAAGTHGASCQVAAPQGAPIEADVEDTGTQRAGDGVERTLAWTLDAGPRSLSRVDACGDDGTLEVRPSGDERVRVVAELAGDEAEALDEVRPRVRFAREGEGLSLAVDLPRRSPGDEPLRHEEPDVRVAIHVPRGHAPEIDLRHDDGDARVAEVTAPRLSLSLDDGDAELASVSSGELELRIDDGHVAGRELDVGGDVDLHSDDGTFDLEVVSIASGDWRARTDDATIGLDLPAGDEIGYDVEARNDDGYSRILLENSGMRSTAEGGTASARSTDFADRSTQVRIDAVADDGTTRIVSR